MRFLGDMGVSWRVIEWLRAAGHDAVHLRDEGLQRLPNGDIFQKGFTEQRIVLTFDVDFGEILAESAGRVVSVVRNTCASVTNKREPFAARSKHRSVLGRPRRNCWSAPGRKA